MLMVGIAFSILLLSFPGRLHEDKTAIAMIAKFE
jgi:hypothetical protein